MKDYISYRVVWLLLPGTLMCLAGGCAHDSQRVGLYPASKQVVDVFTCKGLDEEGRWIEITDQFLPDADPYVVVAAQLQPEHRESWITFELTSPADFVVMSETTRYPKETDLGCHFDIERLMEVGGEGEWLAVVYADAMPLGKATFRIGEKRGEFEALSRYHVISEEDWVSEPFEPAPDVLEAEEPLPEEKNENTTEPPAPAASKGDENNASRPTVTPESPQE